MPKTPYASLEDLIGRYQAKYPGMSRGQAFAEIEKHAYAHDPTVMSIPGFQEDFQAERMRNMAGSAVSSFLGTVSGPGKMIAKALVPQSIQEAVGPAFEQAQSQMDELAGRSALGNVAGQVAAFSVPGGPGEVSELVPAVSRLPSLVRGAASGALLGATGFLGEGPQRIPFTDRETSPTIMGMLTGGAGGVLEDVFGGIASRWAGAADKAQATEAESVLAPEDQPSVGPSEAPKESAQTVIAEAAGLPSSGAAKAARQAVEQPRAKADDLAQGVAPIEPSEARRGPSTIFSETPLGAQQRSLYGLQNEPYARTQREIAFAKPGIIASSVREPVSESGATPRSVPTPPRPLVQEQPSAWFAVPPAKSQQGFLRTPEERLRAETTEPIGRLAIRQGQPFEVSRYNMLQGQRKGLKVYAYPESSLGKMGQPGPRELFEKPMVLDVPSTGPQALVDAAQLLYADDIGALRSLENAKDQVGLAQEMIGRKAQFRGHDAVAISTPDEKGTIILGLKQFKPSAHTEEGVPIRAQGPVGSRTQPKPQVFDPTFSKPMGGEALSPETIERLMKEAAAARRAVPPGPDPEQHAFGQKVQQVALEDSLEGLSPEWQEANKQTVEASLNGFSHFRPVASAIDHPKWQAFMMNNLSVVSRLDRLVKEWRKVDEAIRAKIPESEFDELTRAWRGLAYDQSSQLRQTAVDVSPRHTEAALMLERKIAGPAYTLLTGIEPEVPAMMQRFGLEHTRKQFERLRIIQEKGDKLTAMVNSRKPPTSAEEIVAAATKGKLNFDDSHDLEITPGNGFLSFYPIENEKAKVENAIKFLESHKQSGYGSTSAADTIAKLEKYKKRLDYINSEIERENARPYPARDYASKYKFYAPLASMKNEAARPLFPENNAERIVSKYITGVVDKRQSDVVLAGLRDLRRDEGFRSPAVQDYMTEYANAVRGARGNRGDRVWAEAWNRSFGKIPGMPKATASDIHNITSSIMSGMLSSRLLWSPIRFPIINLTHLFVGLFPITGTKVFARAVADVLSNPSRWFDAAAEGGAIRAEQDWIREIAEPETLFAKRRLPNPAEPLTYATENFRRAVAYRAGLLTEPGERSPLVKAFNPRGHASELEARKAYARALTLTTQFETSMINKPLAFSGSPLRRLASQFRTWPSNIAALYWDMFQKGQYRALMRGMTALWMFGGVSAASGVGPLVYDIVRDHFLRHGVVLPNETGVETIADTLGLQGTPLDWVSGMNLYSLHDPFALIPPRLSGLGGPAIGSAVDTVQELATALKDEDTSRAINTALGAVSPQLRATVEAAKEYFLDRGKVFGPSGHIELDRPLTATILRGLDLTPSARSIRWQSMQDMASAMESGSQTAMMQIQQKAERDGVVLDGRFWQSVKRIVKSRAKKPGLDEMWSAVSGEQ